jgi:hypothetical protein
MPYKLRKAPKRDLYWVVTIETGKKHSKDPIPLDKAQAQMRILEKQLVGGITTEEYEDIFNEFAGKKDIHNTVDDDAMLTLAKSLRDKLTEHQAKILELAKPSPPFRDYNYMQILNLIISDLSKSTSDPTRLRDLEQKRIVYGYFSKIAEVLKLEYHKYEQDLPIAPLPKPKIVRKEHVVRHGERKLVGGITIQEWHEEVKQLGSEGKNFYGVLSLKERVLGRLDVTQRTKINEIKLAFDALYNRLKNHPTETTRVERAALEDLLFPELIGQAPAGNGKPSNDIMQQIAKQSYKIDNPQQKIEDWN